MKIENPVCPMGYPEDQLRDILDNDGFYNFRRWMVGQTVSICDGKHYNHETREYEASVCAGHPHGTVYYRSDVERFLKHLPIID